MITSIFIDKSGVSESQWYLTENDYWRSGETLFLCVCVCSVCSHIPDVKFDQWP